MNVLSEIQKLILHKHHTIDKHLYKMIFRILLIEKYLQNFVGITGYKILSGITINNFFFVK